MGENVTDFVDTWVQENIYPTVYAGGGEHHPETEMTVERLLADADREGITRDEIEEHFGDLEAFIDNAFEKATDDEVRRQAEKDD